MSALARNQAETISPSHPDREWARTALAKLKRPGSKDARLRLKLGSGDRASVELPRSVTRFVIRFLGEVAAGRTVAMVSVAKEVSTQEAADLLGVSRPFIVKQLESGELPFRAIGTHRRIIVADLLAYKLRMSERSKRIMKDLTQEGQDWDRS